MCSLCPILALLISCRQGGNKEKPRVEANDHSMSTPLNSVASPFPFRPTPESIPPHNVSYLQKPLHSAPVNYHPLVRRVVMLCKSKSQLLVHRTQSAFCCMPLSYTQTSLPLPIPMPTSQLSTHMIYGDSVHSTPFSLLFNSQCSRAQRIQNLAYALIQAGIRPGDRVAILAPNS